MAGIATAFLLCTTPIQGQLNLDYKPREMGYWEGVRFNPVSSGAIDLVSVLVDYQEPASTLPGELKIRFFLPDPAEAHLIIRELDNKYYYWLDKVTPPEGSWKRGFGNLFSWGTAEVLQRLDRNLDMYELGALVRLGPAEPSADQRVAPAVLYHSSYPTAIKGYLFTLKTPADAEVTCTIFREGLQSSVAKQIFTKARGERPLTFFWDAGSSEAGPYKLVAKASLNSTNKVLPLTVRFFHQPRLQ